VDSFYLEAPKGVKPQESRFGLKKKIESRSEPVKTLKRGEILREDVGSYGNDPDSSRLENPAGRKEKDQEGRG
jgi:hypothetical protein